MSGFGLVLANYIRRGFAYRWLLAVPTVILFALVTFYVSIQPDSYESQAILMKPIAKAGESEYIREINAVARDMFRSAAERMLSTKMLRKVVEDVDPYPELREIRGADAVVDELRRHIRIETNHRTGAINIFVSHSSGDRAAEMSAEVANSLTSAFVDSQKIAINDKNTKLKVFFDTEKARLRKELETAENRLESFKAKYSGSLPEDVATNMDQIDRLGQSIVDYRQNNRSSQREINRLNTEMARLQTEIVLADDGETVDLTGALRAAEKRLGEQEIKLQDLLHTFAEDSREVQRQVNLIKVLQGRIKDLRAGAGKDDAAKQRKSFLEFLMSQYRKDKEQVGADIEETDKVITRTQTEINDARKRIVTATKIESQLQSLERTVEDCQGRWDNILDRHAKSVEVKKIEEYDGSTPIAVEQRAFVPARPASPDRLITSVLGLLLGLGIGVGIAIAHNRLDVSYQRADQLRALLPGAVLVTIPDVNQEQSRVGRAILGVFMGLLLTGLFVVTLGVLGVQLEWWGQPEMIQPLINLR